MKKVIVFFIGLLLSLSAFSQRKAATFEATIRLETDSLFVWKNDTIQKDSLVYIDFSITGDSIRFKALRDSSQWTKWLVSEDFGIRQLTKNRVPYKGDSTLVDSPVTVVDGNIGIWKDTAEYTIDIGGTLGVWGNAMLNATLGVSGNTTLYSNLGVAGVSTFNREIVQNSGSIGTNNFVSQQTGWRGLYNGNWDMRLLYVDELRAKAFTADVAQALAGSDFLTKSVSKLSVNFLIPSTGYSRRMIIDDLEGFPGIRAFSNGDYIRHRVFDRSGGGLVIADVWGTVALDTMYGTDGFLAGTQAYQFTATDDGGVSGLYVHKGAEVLDYGKSGDGIIERTVLDAQGSPWSRYKTWTTDPSENTNYTTWAALGNLGGITNASGWGLYSQNAFLTNKLLAGDLTKTGHYIEYNNGVLTLKGVMNIAGGSGWANLSDKPAPLGTPSGSGLFLSSTHLGYYSSGTWASYLDNSGNFIIGNLGSGFNGLVWTQSLGTLDIAGNITITGGSGWANLSDKPTSLSGINSSEGSKLSGIQAGATAGATWGTNLSSIPSYLQSTAPDNSISITNNFVGFHAAGTNWPVRIANDGGVGKFYAGDGDDDYIDWNGSTLTIEGSLRARTGYFGNSTTGWNIGSSYVYNDTYKAGMSPSDYPFYAGQTYANRATAPFRISTTGKLTASGVDMTGNIYADTLYSDNAYIAGGSKIGSFTVSGTSDGYYGSIISDAESVYIRAGTGSRFAAIGSGTFPSSMGGTDAVGYFENTTPNSYSTNYAIYAQASNSGMLGAAYSLYGDGNIGTNGGVKAEKGMIILDTEISQLPNVDNGYAATGYHLYMNQAFTTNRNIYLPNPADYEYGECITFTMWNFMDMNLYPRSGDYIQGQNTRAIRLRNAGDNCTLMAGKVEVDGTPPAENNNWTIIHFGGTNIDFE